MGLDNQQQQQIECRRGTKKLLKKVHMYSPANIPETTGFRRAMMGQSSAKGVVDLVMLILKDITPKIVSCKCDDQ
jgi:hypothetical protein